MATTAAPIPPISWAGLGNTATSPPGTCVIRIPDDLTDEEVAPANCALATVVAGWDAIEVRAFENVLIQGAGAARRVRGALARHYGCRRIIVTDGHGAQTRIR